MNGMCRDTDDYQRCSGRGSCQRRRTGGGEWRGKGRKRRGGRREREEGEGGGKMEEGSVGKRGKKGVEEKREMVKGNGKERSRSRWRKRKRGEGG